MSQAGLQTKSEPEVRDLPPIDPSQPLIVGDDDTELSPEDAVRVASERVTKRDADENEASRLRADAQRAQADAVAARSGESQAVAARIQERGTAIASGIDAAKSQKTAALAAYRSARENGDIDAEVRANESLTDASAKLIQLDIQKRTHEAEVERLKTVQPVQEQVRTQQGGYSPAAQAWIDKHPRFNTDDIFQGAMIGAHRKAINDGVTEGSPAYFRELDKAAERWNDPQPQQEITEVRTQTRETPTRRSSSTAAPVARDTGGSGGGNGFTFRNPDGSTLTLSSDRDGKPSLKGTIQPDWVQAAAWSRMEPVKYAISQMQIQKEVQEGGPAAGLQARISGSYK